MIATTEQDDLHVASTCREGIIRLAGEALAQGAMAGSDVTYGLVMLEMAMAAIIVGNVAEEARSEVVEMLAAKLRAHVADATRRGLN